MANMIQPVSAQGVKATSSNYYTNRSLAKKEGRKLFIKDFSQNSFFTIPIAAAAAAIKGALDTKNVKSLKKQYVIDNLKSYLPLAIIVSFLIALFSGKADKE